MEEILSGREAVVKLCDELVEAIEVTYLDGVVRRSMVEEVRYVKRAAYMAVAL